MVAKVELVSVLKLACYKCDHLNITELEGLKRIGLRRIGLRRIGLRSSANWVRVRVYQLGLGLGFRVRVRV